MGKLTITQQGPGLPITITEEDGFDWEGFALYLKARLDQHPGVAASYIFGATKGGEALKFLLKG